MPLHPRLYLGTQSWSHKSWEEVFYPEGAAPGDYLAYYATRFRAVEVDATFYRIPSESMTKRWARALPDGFRFSAKVPQVITHEKTLENCGEELRLFLGAMDHLGDKLGPILFQFPYFNKKSGMTGEIFNDRLRKFLPQLPEGYRFALEIRNKAWLNPAFLGLLRDHGVAYTLVDHPWMPRIGEVMDNLDPATADFAYVRWLGDRRGIEKKTTSWEKLIVDRSREMEAWVPALRDLLGRNMTIYGFFNNHYAGHAPGSIALLEQALGEGGGGAGGS
ncbi:MAG: DUF72 domain-containing protein [Deltaproteobacteria bacterium]|nr:DUF72 domain-containing protein [Deltaproteobacteria bacterium]